MRDNFNPPSIQPANTAPSAQVVNNSGGRIDHANVGSVTFSENLSYNRLLYATDNGSYCGDGCSTGFSDVAGGTDAISISQTATSGAVEVGPLGSFQKSRSYAEALYTKVLSHVGLRPQQVSAKLVRANLRQQKPVAVTRRAVLTPLPMRLLTPRSHLAITTSA